MDAGKYEMYFSCWKWYRTRLTREISYSTLEINFVFPRTHACIILYLIAESTDNVNSCRVESTPSGPQSGAVLTEASGQKGLVDRSPCILSIYTCNILKSCQAQVTQVNKSI